MAQQAKKANPNQIVPTSTHECPIIMKKWKMQLPASDEKYYPSVTCETVENISKMQNKNKTTKEPLLSGQAPRISKETGILTWNHD